MLFFGGVPPTVTPSVSTGKTKNMPPGYRRQQATVPSRHSFKCCDVGRFRGPMNLGIGAGGKKHVHKGNCKMGPRWLVMSGVMGSLYKWPKNLGNWWFFSTTYKWGHGPLLISGFLGSTLSLASQLFCHLFEKCNLHELPVPCSLLSFLGRSITSKAFQSTWIWCKHAKMVCELTTPTLTTPKLSSWWFFHQPI